MVASFLFIFLFIKKMNENHSSHLSCLAIVFSASALLSENALKFSGDRSMAVNPEEKDSESTNTRGYLVQEPYSSVTPYHLGLKCLLSFV